jgi:hypothetical protein
VLVGTVHVLSNCRLVSARLWPVDVKHHAWVSENNARPNPQRLTPRASHAVIPIVCSGSSGAPTRRETAQGVSVGYGTGIVSATDVAATDVVLAEWTQTFNHRTSPTSTPQQVCRWSAPTNVTADAAFDAWHVIRPVLHTAGWRRFPNQRGRAQRVMPGAIPSVPVVSA